MGLKKDLKTIADFVDNPYEVETKPEQETIRVFVEMLIAFTLCLGLCSRFGIIAFGPLSIYPVILLLRVRSSWKELGWNQLFYWLPFISAIIIGIVLYGTNALYNLLGIIFRFIGFN